MFYASGERNVIKRIKSIFSRRHYLLLKAHYFLYYACCGAIGPTLNITLRHRGLTNVELSYINLVIAFF